MLQALVGPEAGRPAAPVARVVLGVGIGVGALADDHAVGALDGSIDDGGGYHAAADDGCSGGVEFGGCAGGGTGGAGADGSEDGAGVGISDVDGGRERVWARAV